jgi:hypothetical protein
MMKLKPFGGKITDQSHFEDKDEHKPVNQKRCLTYVNEQESIRGYRFDEKLFKKNKNPKTGDLKS